MYDTTKLAEDTPLKLRIIVKYSATFVIGSSELKNMSIPDLISLKTKYIKMAVSLFCVQWSNEAVRHPQTH